MDTVICSDLPYSLVVYFMTLSKSPLLCSVLATGPEGRGFELRQDDVILRAIKIRSTPSCRMGSKAGVPMS
jgi:hypothetical protein